MIAGAAVTNVALTCTTNTYTVGGTIKGLAGSGLVLQDNAGDDLAISSNGAFTFATKVASGVNYAVTVKTQPGSPSQTCAVGTGSGAIANGNISNVTVTCTTPGVACGTPNGVIVQQVQPGGPADKGGIKAGDIITTIDGRNIKDGDDLVTDRQRTGRAGRTRRAPGRDHVDDLAGPDRR